MSNAPSPQVPFPDIPRMFWYEIGTSTVDYGCDYGGPSVPNAARQLLRGPLELSPFISSAIDESVPDIRHHLPSLDIDYPVEVERAGDVWRVRIKSPQTSVRGIQTLLVLMGRLGLTATNADETTRGSRQLMDLPVIEFTCEVVAIPSSTPGHFHLYVRKPLETGDYDELMEALLNAGVIESNFYMLFRRNRFTLLLKPGLTKTALAASA